MKETERRRERGRERERRRVREKSSLSLRACCYMFSQAEEFASDQPYNSESVAKETVQTELDQLGVSLEKTGMYGVILRCET